MSPARRPALQVSLLRGINVGRANRIGMQQLRAVYEGLGCRDVTTHLQSGNVVLRDDRTPEAVSAAAEAAIRRELGLDVADGHAAGRALRGRGRLLKPLPQLRSSAAGYHRYTRGVSEEPTSQPDHVRPATAAEAADVRAMHAANRAAWDEAAERYEGWLADAIELIRGGGTNLFDAEVELIGDLHGRCRRAIHLQCAGGRDTLSLWNLGAEEVVGVDFSPRMLDLAARLTAATGAPARWIRSDVLDTPHELDGTGDLVYTGRGSLIWLHDLDAWAAVIARLLSPRGRFVLFDGHPAEWLFDVDEDGRWIATDYDYFGGAEASKGWAREYIDRLSLDDADQSWKFARAWTLGEVITALLRADLRLERVTEHPIDWWGGHADVRDDERGRIPLSFSVVARAGSPARDRVP